MSLTEIPEKFFGQYKLERSEKFGKLLNIRELVNFRCLDEFLASKGVNWFLRKIIGM
jgi:hypothetical protein